MPWKECHVMDERVRFVARLLDGEKMVVLCEEFGISRKTGIKIYQRYKEMPKLVAALRARDSAGRSHLNSSSRPVISID